MNVGGAYGVSHTQNASSRVLSLLSKLKLNFNVTDIDALNISYITGAKVNLLAT